LPQFGKLGAYIAQFAFSLLARFAAMRPVLKREQL
jgi:hypothetical protein